VQALIAGEELSLGQGDRSCCLQPEEAGKNQRGYPFYDFILLTFNPSWGLLVYKFSYYPLTLIKDSHEETTQNAASVLLMGHGCSVGSGELAWRKRVLV
jgi:hypothetical protein